MGNALVVMTIPEEALMSDFLCDTDEKEKPVRLADLYRGKWSRSRQWQEWLLRRHPNSYVPVRVKPGQIWRPPTEPFEELGSAWIQNPKLRRAHRAAMRASLEAYVNDGLSHLSHMVRTGMWVLERARVRVVVCKPVPEREWRARGGGMRKRRVEKGAPSEESRRGSAAKGKGPSAELQNGPLPPPRPRPPFTGKRAWFKTGRMGVTGRSGSGPRSAGVAG